MVNGAAYSAAEIPLQEQPVYDAFWFAWVAFNPDTDLYE